MKLFNKSKKRKGFTLVELIVVIAILGILAAIAVPRFGGISDTADDTANEATARTIASAVMMYQASYDAMPPAIENLDEFLADNTTLASNWDIGYDTDGELYVYKTGE